MIPKDQLEAAMTERESERLKEYQTRLERVSNDVLVAEARQKQLGINLIGLKAIKYPPNDDRSGYDYRFIAKAIRETTDELAMAGSNVNDLKAYQTHLGQLITSLYEYVADRLVAESQSAPETN
jgi:hypothetical protein